MAAKSVSKPRTASAAKPMDVTVLLLEGGFASTAIGPLEVFHSAGAVWNWLHGETPQPRFKVRTASLGGAPIVSGHGLTICADSALEDVAETDLVIVATPGWDMVEQLAKHGPLVPWLRGQHERGAYIAGVCTGVAFMAEGGLLDGREATTHWALADAMRQRYPKVDWQPEQFVTEDGGLFCSGGVYAAIDLSLYLVEKFCGHEVALQCAKSLLLSMPRGRQSGYAVSQLSPPHSDSPIQQAERYLQANFDHDVSIETLAARTGMSPRNFIRRFKAATGRLPGAYLQTLRISAAREMLEHGAASIQAVCSKVGYEDLTFFRSLFKRHTGMTPAEYRMRFARMNFDRGELASA
jgi:transcriptional regulator GlxA family with amidase domain